jgi:DNA recombination protein RmuC
MLLQLLVVVSLCLLAAAIAIMVLTRGDVSKLILSNEQKLEKMRETVEQKLKALQEDNSDKLEKMRATVDEKLHSTLEMRLGESFKQVSDRLEQVHKGLGEMQTLAAGVGDLKKVLTNVKTRGTWGEIQLQNLLEQVLTVEQYEKNIVTKKGSRDPVEFAIKLPGRSKDDHPVFMPIDSKFPKEDYERLIDAQERSDAAGVEDSSKKIEAKIKLFARDIRDKYLDPPHTTDFGIMFLPVEGLYAEVIRKPGITEILQREYRIIVAGPTTLWAILNSLQMGFRTLAIEKRSSEVWALLGAVKNEFGKFGEILDKTQKKIQEASNTIEDASRKSRTIERQLRGVQVLNAPQTAALLKEGEE